MTVSARRLSVPRAPLPALPRLGAGTEVRYRPGGRGMAAVLHEEHGQLAVLLDRLARTAEGDPRRRALVSVLIAAVTRHLCAEEQYLYPTVRTVLPGGDGLANEEVAADLALRRALCEAGTDLDRVVPALRAHIARVDGELLPGLRRRLDEAQLIRLGNRVQIALDAAPTRPHPSIPATPPFNKLVDPVVGVLDKVRDVATRRVTYAEDL